jgi:HNH endonuclease
MAKKIALTNSDLRFVVDDGDYKKVAKWKWCLVGGYVWGTRNHISLHQFLLGRAPRGREWDHRDRNKLNNRRSNFRIATRAQNGSNRPLFRNNTSGFRGVTLYREKWRAQIKVDRKTIRIGDFPSKEEAAMAYDKAARLYFGEFASLNIQRFPRLKNG